MKSLLNSHRQLEIESQNLAAFNIDVHLKFCISVLLLRMEVKMSHLC